MDATEDTHELLPCQFPGLCHRPIRRVVISILALREVVASPTADTTHILEVRWPLAKTDAPIATRKPLRPRAPNLRCREEQVT